MSDQKEFVFLGGDGRPYFYKDNWIHWWHPNKNWVTMRRISGAQVDMLPNNISLYGQSLYFKDSDYKPDWYTEERYEALKDHEYQKEHGKQRPKD